VTQRSMATLMEVYIPDVVTPLRYQNYLFTAAKDGTLSLDGNTYSELGFQVAEYSESDLSLSSGDVRIVLQNSSVLKGLLLQYNDLKESTVNLYHIQPGTTEPNYVRRLIVSYSTTDGPWLMFTLSPSTDGLTGPLSSKYIDVKDFPEAPVYRARI
jgi:hypothetical protein